MARTRSRPLPHGLYRRGKMLYLYVSPAKGRRHRIALRTANVAVAEKLAGPIRERLLLEAAGLLPPAVTVSEVFRQFREYAVSRRRPGTLAIYDRAFGRFASLHGERQAFDVTEADVDAWARSRLASVARATVRAELATVRAALNWAKRRRLILDHRVLSPSVTLPAPTRREIVFLDPDEMHRLLDACFAPVRGGHGAERERKTPLGPMAAVALFAGLRLSEVLYLDREDLDLDRREIHVRAKPAEDFYPKTNQERTVPMFRPLDDILAEHVAARAVASGPVFRSQAETRFCAFNAERELRRAARRAGLGHKVAAGRGQGGGCWNVLRHTFASHLVREGMSIFKVSKLLGHASVTTTERHYAGLAPNRLHAEGDAAFAGVWGAPAPGRKVIAMPGLAMGE